MGIASLAALVLLFMPTPMYAQDEADELIEFNPPPELELNLLIQMVSDELSLKVMYDEKIGSQKVKLLVPEQIPRASMRGILESSLRMKGFAIVEGDQPGWLQVVEARNLINIAPAPGGEDGAGKEINPTSALTRVFKLKHYDPQKAEQVIKPYLTEPGGNLQVIAEQRLVIVTDYAPRVSRIEKVLSLIDQPAHDVEVRFHKVINMDAAEALNELTKLMQARRRAQTSGGAGPADTLGLEMIHQARTNRLVLIGESEQLDEATMLLESIDVDLGLQTRLYRFSSVSPGKVDALVQNLIDPGAKARLYRSSSDEENGLLVVTTTPTIHEQVAAVQADVDREIEAVQPVVRYYKLLNAKATEVIATIQQLQGVTVLAESRDRSLVDAAGGASTLGAATEREPEMREPVVRPLQGGPDDRNVSRSLDKRGTSPRGDDTSGGRTPLQASVKTQDATLVTDTNTNTIIVLAEPARQDFYSDLIKQLDKRRPQVMIEVTLVAMSTSEGKSVGVEISRTGDADDEPRVLSFSSFGLTDSTDPADLLAASGLGFNGVILSEDIANVVLRALKTDGQSKVISTPKLLINDNTSGTLTSTLNIPFASINNIDSVTTQSLGGTSDAGTSISLDPQISEGDHIKLGYQIEFSSFGEGGSDTLPPPKSSQNISSEITIPDGYTVVIGGLNSTDFGESASRVPILGEIPILEYLFSSRSESNAETTFFVFVKPMILRDDNFAGLKYLSDRELELAGLPGDFPTSEPLLMN